MRIALFTDIHGNREALEACLADAKARGADWNVFLGDLVGYGADPAWVVDAVIEEVARGAVAIKGNHDDAVEVPADMNDMAMAAIAWTIPRLDAAQRAFLASLPLSIEDGERLYVHANAEAPGRWDYILDSADARLSFAATRHRVILCGHVHVGAIYSLSESGSLRMLAPNPAALALAPDRRWLAIIPAVGQPRDGNPAAGYALLDTERNELTIPRVRYDVEKAARKILDTDLPPVLALRLVQGR